MRLLAKEFSEHLIEVAFYKIHTILTDNGIQFTKHEGAKEYAIILFGYVCIKKNIDHRLTKVKHLWNQRADLMYEQGTEGGYCKKALLLAPRTPEAHMQACLDSGHVVKKYSGHHDRTGYHPLNFCVVSTTKQLTLFANITLHDY